MTSTARLRNHLMAFPKFIYEHGNHLLLIEEFLKRRPEDSKLFFEPEIFDGEELNELLDVVINTIKLSKRRKVPTRLDIQKDLKLLFQEGFRYMFKDYTNISETLIIARDIAMKRKIYDAKEIVFASYDGDFIILYAYAYPDQFDKLIEEAKKAEDDYDIATNAIGDRIFKRRKI